MYFNCAGRISKPSSFRSGGSNDGMNLTLNTKKKKKNIGSVSWNLGLIMCIYIYLIPELSNKHPFRVLIHVISSADACLHYLSRLCCISLIIYSDALTHAPTHTCNSPAQISQNHYRIPFSFLFLSRGWDLHVLWIPWVWRGMFLKYIKVRDKPRARKVAHSRDALPDNQARCDRKRV